MRKANKSGRRWNKKESVLEGEHCSVELNALISCLFYRPSSSVYRQKQQQQLSDNVSKRSKKLNGTMQPEIRTRRYVQATSGCLLHGSLVDDGGGGGWNGREMIDGWMEGRTVVGEAVAVASDGR
uniref:Uncharacterized protein n=1 Tax=Syphacia muris TaxID=451379 RepID=A0A0N5ATY0_9BILA